MISTIEEDRERCKENFMRLRYRNEMLKSKNKFCGDN